MKRLEVLKSEATTVLVVFTFESIKSPFIKKINTVHVHNSTVVYVSSDV